MSRVCGGVRSHSPELGIPEEDKLTSESEKSEGEFWAKYLGMPPTVGRSKREVKMIRGDKQAEAHTVS